MKTTIIHPEAQSLEVIQTTINQNQPIYRSPHVGNVNNNELSLVLGIAGMGGTMQLELVDSIRGDDSYSNPRVVKIGEKALVLASRNTAKSRVPGGCAINPNLDDEAELLELGIVTKPHMTLRDVHMNSLNMVLPEAVSATPSSLYFASIGSRAYESVLCASNTIVDRPLRRIDAEGKIRDMPTVTNYSDIYGLGDNPTEGLLPSLEAMMAIEIVKKVVDANGSDVQIVHVAGPDMIRYTKESEMMQKVDKIATSAISELGVSQNQTVEYVVPCMKTIIESDNFDRVINGTVQSQYDILVKQSEPV